MTIEEAKTKPLNELLGFLTELYADCECTCECKVDTWLVSFGDKQSATKYAERAKQECKAKGRYYYCPQQIAYERIMKVIEKEDNNNDD